MFSVLNLDSGGYDLISRLSGFLRQSEPEVRRIEVPGGAPFLSVTAKTVRGNIPWEQIRLSAGNCASRMLLPKGLFAPQGSGISTFSPQTMPLLLCFNTAAEILSRSVAEPSELSIGVLDKSACLTRRIEKIVMLASNIKVVTDKPCMYDSTVKRFMSLYGAHLAVSDSPEILDSCRVIISPRLSVPSAFGCSLLFCPKPFDEQSSGVPAGYSPFMDTVECFGVSLPEPLAALCPKSIDSFLFFCALGELCRADTLESKCFQSMSFNGSDINLYGACQRVKKTLCAHISGR